MKKLPKDHPFPNINTNGQHFLHPFHKRPTKECCFFCPFLSAQIEGSRSNFDSIFTYLYCAPLYRIRRRRHENSYTEYGGGGGGGEQLYRIRRRRRHGNRGRERASSGGGRASKRAWHRGLARVCTRCRCTGLAIPTTLAQRLSHRQASKQRPLLSLSLASPRLAAKRPHCPALRCPALPRPAPPPLPVPSTPHGVAHRSYYFNLPALTPRSSPRHCTDFPPSRLKLHDRRRRSVLALLD